MTKTTLDSSEAFPDHPIYLYFEIPSFITLGWALSMLSSCFIFFSIALIANQLILLTCFVYYLSP